MLKNDSPATKSELVAAENKIPDANSLVKKTDLNAKITEIENKIPAIAGLASNSALFAVKNEIPDFSSLIKKTDYNTKISEIERKVSDHNHGIYITTLEFNNLAAEVFTARLAQTNLVTKEDFDTKLQDISKGLPQIKQSVCLLKMN